MTKELKPPVALTTNGSQTNNPLTEMNKTTMTNTTNSGSNQQTNIQGANNQIKLVNPIVITFNEVFNAALVKQINKFPLTDAGNAECFGLLYKDSLRFCKSIKKWMKWDGFRWKTDTDGEAHRAAIYTVRARKAAATYIGNQDLKMKSEKWAIDSESVAKRNALLATAMHLEDIEIQIDKFDQNPFLAGVKNGTLDLDSGEFREANREDYISMQFNVAYAPLAKAPRWEQF